MAHGLCQLIVSNPGFQSTLCLLHWFTQQTKGPSDQATNIRWFQPHQYAVRLCKSHACYTGGSGENCTTSEHAEAWTVATSNIGGCNSDCAHLEQWTLRGLTSKRMIQHGRSTWTRSCDSCFNSFHFLFLLKDPSWKLQVSAFNRNWTSFRRSTSTRTTTRTWRSNEGL